MFTYKLTFLNIFHLQNQHFLLYSTSKPSFSYDIPPPNQYFLIIFHLQTNIFLLYIFHLQTNIFLLYIFHLQTNIFLLYSTSKPTFSYYIPPQNQYFLNIHILPPNQYFLIHLKTNILKRIFHLQTIIFLLFSTSKLILSYSVPPPNQYFLSIFHLQTIIFLLYIFHLQTNICTRSAWAVSQNYLLIVIAIQQKVLWISHLLISGYDFIQPPRNLLFMGLYTVKNCLKCRQL